MKGVFGKSPQAAAADGMYCKTKLSEKSVAVFPTVSDHRRKRGGRFVVFGRKNRTGRMGERAVGEKKHGAG